MQIRGKHVKVYPRQKGRFCPFAAVKFLKYNAVGPQKVHGEMDLYEKLINRQEKLALVGLGYVGMPLAVAFAAKGLNVIGFDLNEKAVHMST